MESVKLSGMTMAAAGGLAALAMLAVARKFSAPSSEQENRSEEPLPETKREFEEVLASTSPSSAVGSPARSSPVPADLLFFSILDSYNRTTPGLSSSASATPSPTGRRKKRNRRNSKKRINSTL